MKVIPWGRLAVGSLSCAALAITFGVPSRPATAHPLRGASAKVPISSHTAEISRRPNIVFILTDDLSLDLLRFMPHVQAMEQDGMTFKNYFVSDSLCCPSRASILSGRFPHDTGVLANFGPSGGFPAFHDRGEERTTFAVALHRHGYDTALMGKYLNGYLQPPGRLGDGTPADVPLTYVPPGWSNWDVGGWGYPEFDYTLNENGHLRQFGHNPSDYLTDVLASNGAGFVLKSARRHRPFFLELATFSPHSPYVPAPRDARDFAGLGAPRQPNFNAMPTHAPRWLAVHPRLSQDEVAELDATFRRRAQAVESIDRMIAAIEHAVAAGGVSRSTYLVFSSDNGLHAGEYRLMPGKLTAFDTDINVPLVITGPRVEPASVSGRVVENVDLAETFAALGGVSLRGDGHSLVPLLEGRANVPWRNAALIEHRGSPRSVLDPDSQQPASGSPTTYEAMRTSTSLYVEYADGEREFYDLRTDPFELHNRADRLTARQSALLHRQLRQMHRCHGPRQCWNATHVREVGWMTSSAWVRRAPSTFPAHRRHDPLPRS